MERVPMTMAGYEKLKEELKNLISVERPQNIKDIETARDHGDLSENAEYSAAKEKQAMIAAQINILEDRIGRAEVIDPSKIESDKVVFGATVTVYDVETEEEFTYQIVGDDETDIKNNKIGISSPIARSLIGKKEGDEAKVKAPKGMRELEVVSFDYK